MGKVMSGERLQQLLAERKRINENKRLKEEERARKRAIEIEKDKQQREKRMLKKQAIEEKKIKKEEDEHARRMHEFNPNFFKTTSRWFVGETPINELYTLYELQHIEELYPKEKGRINWEIWNKLISK